ncbi:hypothetical protein AgCh_037392 [Apium graveolens]
MEPTEDWGNKSWTVDCACGVNFDDGEEMVNCDERGVWVYTMCSRYVKSEKVFTCEKCRRKSKRCENIEDEVADSLLGMANKSGENYKEFDWNDGNETGGNEGGGNELGSEGSNGGALSLLNNYKAGGVGGSVSFGAGKRTRDEESNKKKREEGEEVNDNTNTTSKLMHRSKTVDHLDYQPSSKVNLTLQEDQSNTLNTPATIGDEELALLLHQELNRSARVSRVPRMRHAGSLPQLASPTVASMLMKQSPLEAARRSGRPGRAEFQASQIN